MKVTMTADLLNIRTEKPDDNYQLGRIAMKFKLRTYDHGDNRFIEIPILQVLKELAE